MFIMLCLLTMSHAVRSVASRALMTVCEARFSILGRIFCLSGPYQLTMPFYWYFRGFGILVVVGDDCRRAFKGLCVLRHVLWHGYYFGMECGVDGDVFRDGRHMS